MLIEQTTASGPRRDILDALWRIGSAGTTRLVLLVLLALSVALGTLLPQLPVTAAADPAMANRWLSTIATRYGTWGTLLRAINLFDIAHAFWFRLLLALLAFHLLLCAVEVIQTAWAALGSHRHPPPFPPDVSHVRWLSLPPPLHEAVAIVQSQLAARRLRVLVEAEETAVSAQLYADRARFGVLGSLLSNVGALFLLMALFINSVLGWQTADLLLAPGQETALGHGTGLNLRLVTAASAADRGRLLFLGASGEAVERPLAFAHPALYGGISVHQTGDGPALMVRGEDEAGRPLALQPLAAEGTAAETVSLIFDQPQAERHLTVPARNLALRLVAYTTSPGSQADHPTFLLQVYRGGSSEPILDTLISEGSTLEVNGARLEFMPERYAVLQVIHAPGLPLLLAGGWLLLVGAILPLIWPTLQVWAELMPERRAVRVRLVGQAQGAAVAVEEELALLAEAMEGAGEHAS